MQALLSVFLGYPAYYIVRNNFTLSTPYLKEQLDLSATQIGLLSSCMLIAYGISKGVMSSLADKASPKVFMACGLGAVRYRQRRVRIQYRILGLRCAGCPERPVSGDGGRPSFITIANWFPRRERGRVGAFWNISHNVGGGIVAPIVGAAFAILGTEHWQSASYIVPACVAVVFAISVLVLGKGSPREEGLPSLAEMMPEEKVVLKTKHGQKAPENMSAFQIFCTYVLRNKNASVCLLCGCVCLYGAFRHDQLAANLPADGETFFQRTNERRIPVFLSGRRFRLLCWPAGSPTSCLKGAGCR